MLGECLYANTFHVAKSSVLKQARLLAFSKCGGNVLELRS